jgi:RNA polymerase sigma-70 factor (ECF subfamily)
MQLSAGSGVLPLVTAGSADEGAGTAAFEAFVRRYQDMVFATAVRLLGNPTDAEDIAQTVFLKAYQRFGDIGTSPSAAGWLKTVTRNSCLNHLTRYRARWRFFSELERPERSTPSEPVEASFVSESSPAKDLEQTLAREGLEAALRQLPDHQRVPLVLVHFEGASYQEAADLLGVSLSKVKTDIHRGREALARRLRASHAPR